MSLLVPGPLGWEVWKRTADGGYERKNDDGPLLIGEMTGLPSGDLAMLFPVRSVHALPFQAPSTDEDLFEDLATMHAERLGVRPDVMSGELTDSFLISKGEEKSELLHVVVRSPESDELPSRTPKEFDLSARAYGIESSAICVWKELGRWVFSIHSDGKLLYCQATSSDSELPDSDVVREIQLSLGQLTMQGMKVEPQLIHLWPPQGELGEPGALEDAFDLEIRIAHRPDPTLPDPPSRILPADVHAARRARAKRNQIMLGVAAVVVLYLGFAGWLGYGLWQEYSKRKDLEADLASKGSVGDEYGEHTARWDELGPVVDESMNPMEVMLSVATSIPRNSGLRLKTADLNFNGKDAGIKLIGAAPQSAPVSSFNLALTRNAKLSWLDWNNQPANNTQKGWEFVFSAQPPKE